MNAGEPEVEGFGPADYTPASVDEFVNEAAAAMDGLRTRYLHVLVELDEIRERLCEPIAPETRAGLSRLLSGSLGRRRAETDAAASATSTTDEAVTAKIAAAAQIIRITVAEAHREAATIRCGAETEAADCLANAEASAEETKRVAKAHAAVIRADAQHAADRISKQAHDRATVMGGSVTIARLDAIRPLPTVVHLDDERSPEPPAPEPPAPEPPAPEPPAPEPPAPELIAPPVPTASFATIPGRREQPTIAVDDDLVVGRERTFEALWHASVDDEDSDAERYFRRTPFAKKSPF